MVSSFISTQSLSESSRLTILKLQQRLAVAQTEVSSERLADVGKTLGARTSETVSLRQDVSRLNNFVDTNASVSGALDVSQQALDNTAKTAQAFISTLIASRDTATGPQIVEGAAKAGMSALTDAMNTSFAGAFVFGGINNEAKPLQDYFGTPTPASRQSVADAFAAQFGFSQSDARVADITPAQMNNFLDTTFADLFEEPAWSANWSDASSQNTQARISPSETIDSSANANDVSFRKLAKVYTMLGDLGVKNMNHETFQAVIDKALGIAGGAVQDVAVQQAGLGTAQGRVSNSNTQMQAEVDILTKQVNGLEAVDPFDAATRVNELTTQLQTAFTITGRIQQLSLVNFL
jgi:flagellar hook-associated protein 3 FlgL